MNHLIDQLLNDVINATIRVDVEESKKAGATPESSKGNVFTVLNKVLSDIAEARAAQGKENEDLKNCSPSIRTRMKRKLKRCMLWCSWGLSLKRMKKPPIREKKPIPRPRLRTPTPF